MRWFVVLLMFLCWSILMNGCGVSALQLHAKAAFSTRKALDLSRVMLEKKMTDRAVKAAADTKSDPNQAEINAHAEIRKFDKVLIAHTAAVEAYKAWVQALLDAQSKNREDESTLEFLTALGHSLAKSYATMAFEAYRCGVDVPYLDDVLEFLYE